MIGKKLTNSEPISLAEAKELIEVRKKEGELSYEQNLTLEYTKKFSKLSADDARALVNELLQIEKLTRVQAIELIDLFPKNLDELRLIFTKEHFVMSDEDLQKILGVLDKYRK
ncbi:TPA: DNA-directed RNA polymerase subunit F [archaeon]|nr:DNA-directed RNA polymerase subunit F [Candidatus Naiadarchaeales archaeon SRR2090153.bin461]HIK02502.1 DNA-directed RNA polymerase subunit F [Candidatus Naiadarchaeales archaeon SRR2090159.bin1288]